MYFFTFVYYIKKNEDKEREREIESVIVSLSVYIRVLSMCMNVRVCGQFFGARERSRVRVVFGQGRGRSREPFRPTIMLTPVICRSIRPGTYRVLRRIRSSTEIMRTLSHPTHMITVARSFFFISFTQLRIQPASCILSQE